jgi:hypothetical protein
MSFIRFGEFFINKKAIGSITIAKRILYIKYPWKLIIKTRMLEDNYFGYYKNREDAEKCKLDIIKEMENISI